jgi:hypothetical protein
VSGGARVKSALFVELGPQLVLCGSYTKDRMRKRSFGIVRFGMDLGLANAGGKSIVMIESVPSSVLVSGMMLICEICRGERNKIGIGSK